MRRKLILVAASVALASGCGQHGRTAMPFTRQWRLNRDCATAGKALWDQRRNDTPNAEPRPRIMDAFYSLKIDTCVQIEVDELRTSYDIRDVTHGFMRDREVSGFDPYIFHCGREGADSVILQKVRELNGFVADKPYGLWQDNGDGGPPATVKAPQHPYSHEDCERLLRKKLDEL